MDNNIDPVSIVETSYYRILQNCLNLYMSKNAAYGNNMSKNYRKYGEVVYALRLSDKFGRLRTLLENIDIPTGDESVLDTIIDSIGYCIMCVGDITASMIDNVGDVNISFTDGVFVTLINNPEIVTKNVDIWREVNGHDDYLSDVIEMQEFLDIAYENKNMASACIKLACVLTNMYYCMDLIKAV